MCAGKNADIMGDDVSGTAARRSSVPASLDKTFSLLT